MVLCLLAFSPIDEPFAGTIGGGSRYTVTNTPDGSAWTWGSNTNGQLGDGATIVHTTPAIVSVLSNVTAVASGGSHVLALKGDGTVWAGLLLLRSVGQSIKSAANGAGAGVRRLRDHRNRGGGKAQRRALSRVDSMSKALKTAHDYTSRRGFITREVR